MTSKPNDYARDVARELGLRGPLNYESLQTGYTVIKLQCTACPETYQLQFSKRFPPEVLRKKIEEKGWDVSRHKNRCPVCVKLKRTARFTERPIFQQPGDEMEAKITVSSKLTTLIVPKESDIFKEFVDEKDEPFRYWSFAVVTEPDGSLLMAVSMNPPPVTQKTPGLSRGSFTQKKFMAQISNSMIENIDKIDPFGSTSVKLIRKDKEHLLFSLPNSRRLQVEPVESPPVPVNIEPPVIVPSPAVDFNPMELIVAPKMEVVQSVITKDTVSIYHLVDAINRYKDVMGDKLDLSISDSGYLTVMAQYGRD